MDCWLDFWQYHFLNSVGDTPAFSAFVKDDSECTEASNNCQNIWHCVRSPSKEGTFIFRSLVAICNCSTYIFSSSGSRSENCGSLILTVIKKTLLSCSLILEIIILRCVFGRYVIQSIHVMFVSFYKSTCCLINIFDFCVAIWCFEQGICVSNPFLM